ncbi:MAG: hypothetical protein BWY63_01371 [Chloroflexi bacterium ADurb.Bin360]|nr:MAG: hypothetical protein BWY63_01371 [Chloroflexi bacterium ADurb.Bin360]
MRRILRCTVCGLPWARIENGVLIVESRHHGERHVNVIPVTALQEEEPEEEQPVWPPELEQKAK